MTVESQPQTAIKVKPTEFDDDLTIDSGKRVPGKETKKQADQKYHPKPRGKEDPLDTI